MDVVVDAYANDERKANPVLKRNDGLEVDAGVVFAGLVNENTDVIWTIQHVFVCLFVMYFSQPLFDEYACITIWRLLLRIKST